MVVNVIEIKKKNKTISTGNKKPPKWLEMNRNKIEEDWVDESKNNSHTLVEESLTNASSKLIYEELEEMIKGALMI